MSCLAAARTSVKLQLATVLSQLITQQTIATETLNGDVIANGWIFNQPDASLTINGELSVNQGLETVVTWMLTALTAKPRYNRETGSITTDLLTLNGAFPSLMKANLMVQLPETATNRM